ncbi:GntR family transcriptional regulator [Devosia chinhatensis]|uniref:GntR family transcriptional regulator n=1 Tax=Devosia chinhatensis TaxID=429727 RepID=A0A0F5FLG5_9HYPH|nr:GntR family transcriptional regulator [Devosia chinhatensis]KKB09638.1 GntR family transcriptional regulator [Devosia chinhatensis]
MAGPARTTAEDIRHILATRIINGELRPGSPLDESGLATEFSVSRTPIREALRLLRASGLVDQRPHSSAVVAKPDEATLAGMFEVMAYLEALCAGLCASMMNGGERQALSAMHAEMAALMRSGNHQAYVDANEAFHSLIYDGAHNAYLAELARSTRQRLQPFRRAQFSSLGRLGRSHEEHSRVVAAILCGDRAGAESAMRDHLGIVETTWQKMATAT